MKYTAPRGTRDLKDREAQAFQALEESARRIFQRYGYEEIRTPVFENVELFKRAVGDTTDIVEKEMYVFEDRGGRKLALRPEGTAGIVRAYLEHAWDKSGGIKKLFYIGPMFRAERPQAGRYREFWQIGAEFFGNPSAQADADVLLLLQDLLAASGLTEVKFLINSIGCAACRPVFREALLKYLDSKQGCLCDDCKRRLARNPLRCLDCKKDMAHFSDAPKMRDSLCGACQAHDQELKGLLTSVQFPYEEAPCLVRGLDYYSRTVFEITAPGLGAQDALGAGGRYDSLVKTLGGPDIPAIGFALGMDRMASAKYGDSLSAGIQPNACSRIFVALAGQGTGMTGFRVLQDLRKAGCTAEIGAPGKSLKAQMRWADAWKAGFVVIVGEEELKRGRVILKNLQKHEQKEIEIENLKSEIEEQREKS